jgi:hypothetical protein
VPKITFSLFLTIGILFAIKVIPTLIVMNYYIDRNGYARFSDSGKLVHRWMAEKKIGRKLNYWEVVHHINRDKLDNHSNNLYVCRNQFHHDFIHLIDAYRFGPMVSLYGFRYHRAIEAI